MKSIKWILIFNLIIYGFVSAEVPDEEKAQVREYIKLKRFEYAENELNGLKSKYKDSIELNLIETELWIEQGEFQYVIGNYKSAYELFSKAKIRWSTHPLVNRRLGELSGKILKNESSIKIDHYHNSKSKTTNYTAFSPDQFGYYQLEFKTMTNQIKIIELENRVFVFYWIIFTMGVGIILLIWQKK